MRHRTNDYGPEDGAESQSASALWRARSNRGVLGAVQNACCGVGPIWGLCSDHNLSSSAASQFRSFLHNQQPRTATQIGINHFLYLREAVECNCIATVQGPDLHPPGPEQRRVALNSTISTLRTRLQVTQ